MLADLEFHIVPLCIHAACALIAANSHHTTPISHANANPRARCAAADGSPYAACNAARHPSHSLPRWTSRPSRCVFCMSESKDFDKRIFAPFQFRTRFCPVRVWRSVHLATAGRHIDFMLCSVFISSIIAHIALTTRALNIELVILFFSQRNCIRSMRG